jgi:calcineurin-like phosphoesterase family protein
MRWVFISDTHSLHSGLSIPDGDVLVHAGDFMNSGTRPEELLSFADWFKAQNHTVKICISGNHDILAEKHGSLVREALGPTVTYLEDSGTLVGNIKVWGSPVTPRFGIGWGFNRDRGFAISQHWRMIPEDTHVLITHGPPDGMLDETPDGTHVGCFDLTRRLEALHDLKLHVFGHIHHSYGRRDVKDLTFVNASVCNERYRPVNAPYVIEL